MKKYPARAVDELGRVVLPIELRKQLGFEETSTVDIASDGVKIILQKSIPRCIVCDSSDMVRTLNNKSLCRTCYDKLTSN